MHLDPNEEIPLPGGDVTEGVVRLGDTVRRPLGDHSDQVHLVLRHLEARGFDGAPRLLGVDDRGKVRLSMKVVDQETGEDLEAKQKAEAAAEAKDASNAIAGE